MNKHGQALITFILFLPLLVLLIGYFINSLLGMSLKEKIDGIVYDNIKMAISDDIRDEGIITNAIKENDSNLDVNLIINEDDLNIVVSSKYKNIFNVFNSDKMDIKVQYCANYVDKIIKKNCE